MKRLCICLCCLLLVLCACGRPAVSPLTESSSGTAERVIPQTQTDVSEFWTASQTETQTEATTEPHSEEVTTAAPTEAASSTQTTQSAATTQKPQTTRAAHTMFTSPQRTTSAHTTTAKASTTRPTAAATTTTTTTTTRPTTTATTVSGGTVPSVQPVRKTCTVTIDCRELRDHPEKLKNPGKAAFVPKNGYIVKDVTAEFKDGESVYDVLRRVCATHTCTDNCRYCAAEGIQMESTYTPQFDSYYVEGIHQLYEKDCGGTSGWTYWINGVFPNYGCSDYIVKPGDRIVWVYSIELDENETF